MKFLCRKKLALVFALALMFVFTLGVNTSFASQKHWADKEMNEWNTKGLLKGDENGNFRADDSITRAEFMALVNRMQNYTQKSDDISQYKDINSNDWYYDTVSIALKAAYIKGVSSDMINPNASITREEAMAIITRISGAKKDNQAYLYAKDSDKVSDWAREDVSTCIKQGFISGNQGKIKPLANITRAEAVVMLNRKLTDSRTFALAGEYDLDNQKVENIMILADGISLKNADVKSDLTINKSLEDGNLNLENINVAKNLYAYGGGENSIYFNSVRVDGSLIVKKLGGKIRIVVKGNSKSKLTVLQSGAIIVNQNKDGRTFEEITIPKDIVDSEKIELIGFFEKVENFAKDINLKLDGSIKELKSAETMRVDGKVKIDKIDKDKDVKVIINDKEKANDSKKEEKTSSSSSSPRRSRGGSSPSSSGNSSSNTDTSTDASTKTEIKDDNKKDNIDGKDDKKEEDDDKKDKEEDAKDIDNDKDYIDPRFADGYPKLKMEDEKRFIYVKLKENPTKPLELFVKSLRYRDNDKKTSPLSVVYGYASEKNPFLQSVLYKKLESNEEYKIDLKETYYSTDPDYCYEFVLRENEKDLGKVTKLFIDNETEKELDTRAPKLSSDWTDFLIYMNNEKSEIRLYFDEELKEDSIPDASDFNLSNGKVDEVKEIKNIEGWHYGMLILKVSDITNVDGLKISYSPNKDDTKKLQDKASPNSNFVESFSDIKIKTAKLKLDNVKSSLDRKHLVFVLEDILYSDSRIEFDIKGQKDYPHSFSWNECIYYFNLNSAFLNEGLKIKATDNKEIVDIAGNKYTDLVFDINKDFTVDYVEKLNLEDKAIFKDDEITIKSSKRALYNKDQIGAFFRLKIDGKEYRLQNGMNYSRDNSINFGSYFRFTKEYDYYTQYILPKLKNALNNGKEVLLVYDTNYFDCDSEYYLRNEVFEEYIPRGETKTWVVTKE